MSKVPTLDTERPLARYMYENYDYARYMYKNYARCMYEIMNMNHHDQMQLEMKLDVPSTLEKV